MPYFSIGPTRRQPTNQQKAGPAAHTLKPDSLYSAAEVPTGQTYQNLDIPQGQPLFSTYCQTESSTPYNHSLGSTSHLAGRPGYLPGQLLSLNILPAGWITVSLNWLPG